MCAMHNNAKGWPLGKAAIHARYHELTKREAESAAREILRAEANKLARESYGLPTTFSNTPRSRSTREQLSKSRSLQRASRRAKAMEPPHGLRSMGMSHSAPQSSPSSGEIITRPNPLITSKSRNINNILTNNNNGSSKPNELLLEAIPKVGGLTTLVGLRGIGNVMTDIEPKSKKREPPKFLAKQFRIISSGSSNGVPRRNIKILGRDTSEASFAACGAKVVAVAEELERDHQNTTSQHQKQTKSLSSDPSVMPSSINPLIDPSQLADPSQFADPSQLADPSHLIVPNLRLDSLSRTPSMSRRSGSPSERYLYSHGSSSSRSVISNLSVPETILSSTDHNGKIDWRFRAPNSCPSSRGEWTSQDLGNSFNGRQGELDLVGLSLGDGRNLGFSERPDESSIADSPAPPSLPDTLDLNYNLDDTHSGVEMYNKLSENSSSSFSRPSSRPLTSSHDWKSELEEPVRPRYQQYGRQCLTDSSSSDSPISNTIPGRNSFYRSSRRDLSSSKPHKKLSREVSGSFNKRNRNGGPPPQQHHHHHQQHQHQPHEHMPSTSSGGHYPQKRQIDSSAVSSKVLVLLGKYGNRKGLRVAGLQPAPNLNPKPRNSGFNDDATATATAATSAVPWDSMSPQEAVAVFQDEVARMMLEEGECDEIADIEDFLDGYMRLRSPFYLEMVEEFFRAVCFDCYRRPLDLPNLPAAPTHLQRNLPRSTFRAASMKPESRRSLRVH